jgi:Zn-dependent protease
MQPPQNDPNNPGAPTYPNADYYRELGARQAPPQPIYSPLPAQPFGAPRMQPVTPQAAPASRGHNAFSRFVIAWGGWNRLWLFLGSGVLSVIVYKFFQGTWIFAIGFVVLICIHEFGHILALRLKRLPATLPIFIPGIGAFVTLPNRPISMRDDAEISLAGPLIGGIGSALCFVVGVLLLQPGANTSVIFDLAYYGFLINALNLIPVLPLDGGHIGRAISRWMSVGGLAVIALLYFLTQNTFLLLIGFYGLTDVVQSFNQPFRQLAMRAQDRVIVLGMYVGVALFLIAGYGVLQSPNVLGPLLHFLRPDIFAGQ